jgi:hypothetical protein
MKKRSRKRKLEAEKEMMQAFKLAPDWAWLYKTICKLGVKVYG